MWLDLMNNLRERKTEVQTVAEQEIYTDFRLPIVALGRHDVVTHKLGHNCHDVA